MRRGSDVPSRIFSLRIPGTASAFRIRVMPAQAKRYVIVQRGQVALFAALQKRYATDPNRQVIWDGRRGEDRRIARLPITVERRREQRRMPVDDGY